MNKSVISVDTKAVPVTMEELDVLLEDAQAVKPKVIMHAISNVLTEAGHDPEDERLQADSLNKIRKLVRKSEVYTSLQESLDEYNAQRNRED